MPTSNDKKSRKQRSDKFPLTLHPTGQFCKKIKGKIYYFGTDKKDALANYLSNTPRLYFEKDNPDERRVTILQLANLYLEFQEKRANGGDISIRHFSEQKRYLKKFVQFIGASTEVQKISTLALQSYRTELSKRFNTPSGLNLNLAIIKSLFNWAHKNDILKTMPNISVLKKARTQKQNKAIFTIEQIKKLIAVSDYQMKAMILLGLNCGFGCTDCAELKWKNLDLQNSRVIFPRGKTGISRNLQLWPETISVLTKVAKKSEFVFLTNKNNAWVRLIRSTDQDGVTKYSTDSALSKQFSKLLKKAGIHTEKGVGFYTLRRTAATLAARSGDPFAVQRLLGHADLKMASVYVQDVSEQTDRVIDNTRKLIIQDGSSLLEESADDKLDKGAEPQS